MTEDPGDVIAAGVAERRDDASTTVLSRTAGTEPAPAAWPGATSLRAAAVLPLTPAQQNAWVNSRHTPGGPPYIIPRAYRLRGSLDGDALARALNVLVQRHEALRTTFAPFDGSPAQLVAARGMASYVRRDLGGRAPGEREHALARLLHREARRPFDLGRGPMLRAVLTRVADDDHVLVLAAPALAADDWSMHVLWRELGEAYSAFRRGQGTPGLAPADELLPGLARLANDRASASEVQRDADWWRDELAGTPPPRPLFGDARTRRGAGGDKSSSVRIDDVVTDSLREFARQERASLFMVLTAVYASLLHRYTGQEALLVGAPTAGRRRPEFETLVGPYASWLPIRIDRAGSTSMRELLRRVRKAALRAYSHPNAVPHVDLQATLSIDDARLEAPTLGGLTVTSAPVPSWAADVDIHVGFRVEHSRMEATVRCRGNDPRAARLAAQLAASLREAGADPDIAASVVPAASTTERRWALSHGRGPARMRDESATIWSLFAESASRRPADTAIIAGGATRSYCELRGEALAIAGLLRERQLPVGSRVGVVASDPVERAAGVLGVLAAGACCVLIDAPTVAARKRIVARADVACLLVGRDGNVGRVSKGGQAIELEALLTGRADTAGAYTAIVPANVAFLHYADPDAAGAVVGHRATVNRLLWHRDAFPMQPGEGLLLAGSDPVEALLPMIAGGHGVVVPGSARADDIVAAVGAGNVSWARLSPAALCSLLHPPVAAALAACRSLRGVIVLTHRLDPDLANRFYRAMGAAGRRDVTLHAVWGTPETAFDVMHRPLPPQPETARLGRPITNARAYVVDSMGGLCPLGVAGELWVGGASVAQRGIATSVAADAITDDPFVKGRTTFRTGLRVRWSADAQLEWIGRLTDRDEVAVG